MKPRKLLTEITGHTALRKQRSQIINSKYLTSHQSTTISGQFSSSIDQLSSITIKDCFEELNNHMAEHRPLRPIFVIQIKRYLNQLKKNGRETNENIEDKRESKQLQVDNKYFPKSPYIVNRSNKKFQIGSMEGQGTQLFRKTLKKKKINYDNMGQAANKQKQEFQDKSCRLIDRVAFARDQCIGVNIEMKKMKGQFLDKFFELKGFISSQLQKLNELSSKQLKRSLFVIKRQYSKRQSTLLETIKELEDKIQKAKYKQKSLQDYLKQRQTQLITMWTAFSMQPG